MSVEHPLCAMQRSKHLGFTGEQKDQERNIPAPISFMFYPGKIEKYNRHYKSS